MNRPVDSPTILLSGAGSIGRRHAGNLRTLLPGARLLAVCRNAASRQWALEAGVEPVESLSEGLAQAPRIAVVSSISSQHAEDLALLMPAVEALYIEKPVVTQAEALAALSASVASGWDKPSVVGCNLRYLGAVRLLKQAVEEGAAGRVAHASFRVGQWLPDWRPGRDWRQGYSADRSRGGGVFFDLVHEIDSAVHLFGSIAKGQAVAASRSSLQLAADDSAVMSLLMRSGLPVQVALDCVSRKPLREYIVTGDEATLRLDIPARRLVREAGGECVALPTRDADWDMGATYVDAMADLLRAWRTGEPTRHGLADSLHVAGWMLELQARAWRAESEPS